MRRKLFNGKMLGVLAVILVLFMAGGVAEEVKRSGNWKYFLEGDGAIITGYVKEPRGTLKIPSKLGKYAVTGIDEGVFEFCNGLIRVVIPKGITHIGNEAFMGCENLTGVTFPSRVTSIGNKAFYGCHRLTGVTLPAGVTSIDDRAFDDCWYLTDVLSIPDTLSLINGGRALTTLRNNMPKPSAISPKPSN